MWIILLVCIMLNIMYNLTGIYYVILVIIVVCNYLFSVFYLIHNPDFILMKFINWFCIIIIIYILLLHINMLILILLRILF